MFSLEEIQHEARLAAGRAAAAHKRPVELIPQDLASGNLPTIPFLGCSKAGRAYTPRPWRWRPVGAFIPGYPYKWLFVDSSGFGVDGEPALTRDGFLDILRHIYNLVPETLATGLGIAEASRFQVHVALYTLDVTKPGSYTVYAG